MSGTLADILVLLHFAFVLFVIFGGLFVLKWKRMAWVHLPAVLWGVGIECFGKVCPLTPLEIWLRESGGERGYQSGFLDHYVVPLLYPTHLTREDQILLGFTLGVINLIIYLTVMWKHRRPPIRPVAPQ